MMKFIHKLTIVLALGGICGLAACSDDDQGFLKRNLREMSFPYVESSDTFTIRATGDWQISDAPDSREWTNAYGWVHVDQLSGKGDPGTYQKVTVTCDQNTSEERSATIYLHGCGEENVAIAIRQDNGIFEWKPFDNGQQFDVSGMLKLNAEAGAKLRIPYIKALGTEKYTVTVTQTGGDGITAASGSYSISTAGNGYIEVPLTGTATKQGIVTFGVKATDEAGAEKDFGSVSTIVRAGFDAQGEELPLLTQNFGKFPWGGDCIGQKAGVTTADKTVANLSLDNETVSVSAGTNASIGGITSTVRNGNAAFYRAIGMEGWTQVLGSAAPYGNYASLKTKGWELSLSWRDSFNLGGKPFSYSIKGMLWDSRSWITDYYNETGDLTTYYKGMEIGEIWGFRTAGIYASNADALNGPAYNFFKNGEMFRAYAGDLRFVDVDGDGIMTKGNRTLSNHGDLEIIGNQSPRYQYSINMSLNWNGIGLSMLWQGVGKRDWYPWTESGFFWGKWNRAYNSLMKTQTGDNVVRIDKSTDNWRVTNMDKNPYWTRMVSLAANRNDGPLTWENDHYLQDASYIRLKNITIDYTFPKHICKKLRLEGLKVYLSGENLFTHSPMFKHTDMFDPEVITSGDSDFAASTTSGLNGTGNGYSYPMLKTVTLGINVTF